MNSKTSGSHFESKLSKGEKAVKSSFCEVVCLIYCALLQKYIVYKYNILRKKAKSGSYCGLGYVYLAYFSYGALKLEFYYCLVRRTKSDLIN